MIRLALQGIHDCRSDIMAYEVLARMECPLSGKIYTPSEFSVASDLSWTDIDVEVFSLLSQNRFIVSLKQPLFINISKETLACSVSFKTCTDLLTTIVGRSGGLVAVEIPESASINGNDLSEVLSAVESTGAKVAIDDFGSMFSVMERLDSHPWDFCKVDLDSFRGSTDLDWLIQLKNKCLARKIKVVFERLERFRDKDILSIIPDAWIQGYAYSRPELLDKTLINGVFVHGLPVTSTGTVKSLFAGAI